MPAPPPPPRPPRARTAAASSYWALARTPRYSLVLALPLLVLYETLAAALGDLAGLRVRNGADVWLKAPFLALFGPRGPVVFGTLLVVTAAALVARDVRRARDGVRGAVLLRMLAESAALAAACALAVGFATRFLLGALSVAAPADPARLGAPARLMLSLGAGLYEELLFRVALVTALAALARRALALRPGPAAAAATVAGALLFSLAHHLGPLGEPFTAQAFAFRFVAGLFFSAVFVLRGFGIAAWTHALYDVGVLVLGA